MNSVIDEKKVSDNKTNFTYSNNFIDRIQWLISVAKRRHCDEDTLKQVLALAGEERSNIHQNQ